MMARGGDLSTSVQHILQMCHDFSTEKQRLITIVEDQLGGFIQLTPKCHPDLTGRGIYYAWAYSKLHYRRNINDAVTAHGLDANIKKALTRELLTTNRVRKHARKARDHKLTYTYILDITKAQVASAGKFHIEHTSQNW